ncbi:MAG TPA: hypothetical protein VFM46_07150 [Pseudomonadales bacterium]|nr:hypothetical protein [Pseudomonadales bacterium]
MMALLALAGTGCNDSSSSSDSQSTTSPTETPRTGFPSFYSLAKEALPATTQNGAIGMSRALAMGPVSSVDPSFPSTYTTDGAEFTTAFSVNQNYIGQVLNDAGEQGPVKSMFVLLAQADSIMDEINSQYTAEDGSPAHCTAITNAISVVTPFFSSAANPAFNSWDDASKYTCYVESSGGALLFGRQAIATPSEGCTDPYEYYVMSGDSVLNEVNTEQTDVRGTTRSISALNKFYYNGCSKDLKISFAHSTLYAAGVEFSSRSEIIGNTDAHTFSVRANYIDADTSYANHITIVGTGTSKTTEGGSTAHFVMGYRSDDCGNNTNSYTCSPGTAKTFCVKNSGSSNNYELENNTAQCDGLSTEYQNITPLERTDIPSGFFDTTGPAFDLYDAPSGCQC